MVMENNDIVSKSVAIANVRARERDGELGCDDAWSCAREVATGEGRTTGTMSARSIYLVLAFIAQPHDFSY